MAPSFKQLPIDSLITTWRGKLPANIYESYAQMARIIADRDLNLAILFSASVNRSIDAYTPSNVSDLKTFDASSATLDNVRNVLGSLILTLQGSGIIR